MTEIRPASSVTTPDGVLDTSVFIAAQSGRQLDESLLPVEAAICAASRDLPVVTQDDDFGALAGIAGLRVVRC